jgi:hypothetical protein
MMTFLMILVGLFTVAVLFGAAVSESVTTLG